MTTLCRLEEIPDGGARGVRASDADGREQRLVVLRSGDRAWAYTNVCPHLGTPLDWRPDEFFDAEGRHLVCATHGALFQPEDGLCVAGPCAGDGLEAVAVEVRGGVVRLADASGTAG